MCLVIESGFWFIESGVTIPVEVVHQHPASVSILPDCFISILVSSMLVVVHPVGSLQLLQLLQLLSAEARRPLIVIAICSVVIGAASDWLFATIIATVCRGSLMVDP